MYFHGFNLIIFLFLTTQSHLIAYDESSPLPQAKGCVGILSAMQDRDLDCKDLRLASCIYIEGNTMITNLGLQALNKAEKLILRSMPQLDDQSLDNFQNLDHLSLTDCPGITAQTILQLPKLTSLYLWSMPHISDLDLRKIREKKIRVFDGRSKSMVY